MELEIIAVKTLLLTALLTATAAGHPHGESPLRADTGTEQEQRRLSATTEQHREQTPSPNQTIGKEEIREIVQQALAQQAQPSLPSWLGPFLQYSAFVVAVFTALTVFLGVLAWRHKKEMEDAAREMRDTKQELDIIVKDARKKREELHAMTAEDVEDNPDKAKEIAAKGKDYETPIDRAIAEAVAYQNNQEYERAKERWLAIANITDEQDKATAAGAYFSAAYLIHRYDSKYKNKDEATINDAISLYNKAIRLKPDFTRAINNRGVSKRNLGQYREAIEDFNKSLGINPDDANAINNRGIVKDDLGQYLEAIVDYDKALKIKPNDPEILNNRGFTKTKLGQYQEAMEDCNKALAIMPDSSAILHSIGYAKAGMGLHQEAIKNYDKALKINPDRADHIRDRGIAKLELGDIQGAKEDAEKALQIESNNEGAKTLLIEIQAKLRNR